MAINAQFPSWITESRIAEAQLGQQMGRNILEGLRFQEQKRQAAEEQRRYDALAPMRTAQMELMRARTTQEILDAEKQREALNIENRFNANQVEALRFQEGIARSAGNYSSPENEASFYRFLSKNPDFTRTAWAKKMEENFKLGRENAFKAEQLEKSLTTKVDVAEIRGQPKPREMTWTVQDEVGQTYSGTEEELKLKAETNPRLKRALYDPIVRATIQKTTDPYGRVSTTETIKSPITPQGQGQGAQPSSGLPPEGAPTNELPVVNPADSWRSGEYLFRVKTNPR
jgi:hypothetical protein